jgi:plastocyanin
MQPDPVTATADARSLSPRRGRSVASRPTRGAALAAIATVGLLLIAIVPASAATVDRSWRAKVGTAGANGAITVVAYTSGTGLATLRLKALPRSTMTTVTLRAGTCAKPGAIAATLAPARSSTGGALNGTRSLATATVARLRAASSLIATTRAGSFTRCATLARVALPSPSPSTSPSPSPSASDDSATLEVRAAGFAYSPTSLSTKTGTAFAVELRNDDAGVLHGFTIGTSTTSTPLFSAPIITGKAREAFTVPALPAGTYVFYCPVHPSMKGTLTVGATSSVASPSPVASAGASPTAAASASPASTPSSSPSASPDDTPHPTSSSEGTPKPTPTYSY